LGTPASSYDEFGAGEVPMQRVRVGIVIYEDVEVLDFCGSFEVFSVTRLNEDKQREEPSRFSHFWLSRSRPL
jgi:hypothetical protein